MNLRRLYRTIESFASDRFRTDKELLKHVLNEIVKSPDIKIKGGRIWEFDPKQGSFRLVHQIGQIERIEPKYRIPVDYPAFQWLGDQRSIIANETDPTLRRIGIVKFAATGVGERLPSKHGEFPQYVLAFNADELDQSLLADLNIISVAVTSSLRGQKIEQKAKAMAKDIDKAREIQLSILPDSAKRFYHYDIYGVSEAAQIVGGDFFDYVTSDDDPDRLSIVVGDAASKGFSAAAQALYVVGALRMGTSYHMKISAVMSGINRLLNRTFAEEQFVTMVYAELTDNAKGLLLYSNAGHNSPLVYHEAAGTVEELEPTGQILGPFPEETFRVENTMVAPGDMVVIFTDGLSEARDAEGNFYTEARVREFLQTNHHLTAREFCDALMRDVTAFEGSAGSYDDKTLVVIKRLHDTA